MCVCVCVPVGEQLSSLSPAALHPADTVGAGARPLRYLAGSGGYNQQSCAVGPGLWVSTETTKQLLYGSILLWRG